MAKLNSWIPPRQGMSPEEEAIYMDSIQAPEAVRIDPEQFTSFDGADATMMPADYVTAAENYVPESTWNIKDDPATAKTADDATRAELLKKYSDKSQEIADLQSQGVAQNEADINALQAEGPSFNWAPGAALIDSWTGSNLSKGTPKTQTPEEFKEKVLALKNELQKRKGDASQAQLNILKNQINDPSFRLAQAATLRKEMKIQGAIDSAKRTTLTRIASDKTLFNKLMTYQTLDNALANLASGKFRTVQGLEDAQQLVIKALGIGGQSGVSERQERILRTLELKLLGLKQYVGGKPEDIMNNPGARSIVEYIQDLARQEQTNAKDQYTKRLAAVAGGNDRLFSSTEYGRQAFADIQDYIKNNADQFNTAAIPDIPTLPKGAQVHTGSKAKPFAPSPKKEAVTAPGVKRPHDMPIGSKLNGKIKTKDGWVNQ